MSAFNVVLPLGSSLLSFVFAAMVLDQWWQRRHSFQLVWAIGLLWYGISAGTEFLGSAFGWSEPLTGRGTSSGRCTFRPTSDSGRSTSCRRRGSATSPV